MAAYYYPPAPPHHEQSYSYYQAPPPPPPGVGPPPLPPPVTYPPSYPTSYAPPPPSLYPHQDEVRTLFVAGLPEDVKAREVYNLFRDFPGFHSSQLKIASQAFAFAVFLDQQSAVAAMHALNGFMFDLEKESVLYIDLAKSNSRSKRSRTDEAQYSDKRYKGSTTFTGALPDSGAGSNLHMPGMGNSAYNTYPPTQSVGSFDSQSAHEPAYHKSASNSLTPYVPQNNTPCATLFVANLGPTCTEQELNQIFSRCSGFLKLKMQNKHGAPVAFVDFKDVACSSGALNQLQGTMLYSSDGEGMRMEYAKSRMGLQKREKT
ncbi:hypothetical protein H6P81_020569 [Aristolochia fimbriata]|uniref:RRM domain-containing protein n=1 Tax=Aristolochia fimbriata TaxID=158543 RepID=A0AAV7DV31_ARIFI|nr:hypothetical protein H6P81_020569 [Aristolochia fimbriata]